MTHKYGTHHIVEIPEMHKVLVFIQRGLNFSFRSLDYKN